MDIVTILVVAALLGVFYFLIDRKLQSKDQGSDAQKLMLDVVEKMRTDLRGGLDKNTEHLQAGLTKNSDFIQKRLDQTVKQLNQQFTDVRKTVDTKIEGNTKALNERLDGAAKVIHGVKEELGRMKEIGGQIKKLQEVLGGQKLRGNLGEQVMNDLISQVIPHAKYEFQYSFKGGDTVDAVILTQNGMIPIDSKFPLENYRRILSATTDKEKEAMHKDFSKDVKKHINDIHKKYIKPSEGTVDFALMYVPADSVYFEIIVNSPNLSSHAQDKRIYIVSPSSFYSFLQIVLMSYQSQQFEEHAKQVLDMIRGVKQESEKFGQNLSVLNKHINNAKVKMDDVQNDYTKLDGKITHISSHNVVEAAKGDTPELVGVVEDPTLFDEEV